MSAAARRLLIRSGTGTFDISKIGLLPRNMFYPLRRNGLDPIAKVRKTRERSPISRMPVPFGLTVWLITGYDEAKAVLADADGFSTDFANLAGGAMSEVTSPGGLGFADPPVHTRLRKLLTPEFTMRRLARLTPRIHEIVDAQLDAMEATDGP